MYNIELDMMIKNYETRSKNVKNKFKTTIREFNDFNNLSVDRKNELKVEANILKEKFVKNDKIGKNYYSLLFHLCKITWNSIYKNKRLYSPEEILSILIETIDPNLTLLKISRKTNSEFKIETLSNKLFGFYDPSLIEYEREYAKRFYKSNVETLMKKLEAKRS